MIKKYFADNFFSALIIIFLIFFSITSELLSEDQTSYIRHNQIGYLTNDQKIAIVGSQINLEGQSFFIVDSENPQKVLYTGVISSNRGKKNTPFNYNLTCNFSSFNTQGTYRIKLADGTLSDSFVIGALEEYKKVLAAVFDFFRSQRCGDISPILHNPCHLNDTKAAIDVSGGWHDAGDYIKYMITVTFATVELATAADYAISYNLENALDDNYHSKNIPDLLDETRIGLDWILKMTSDYENGNYYYQVSGAEDHQGWRMPEEDDTTRDAGKSRSLHQGWGGNLLGRSVAALAIASRIYKKYDNNFADECLKRAEALFAERNKFEYAQKSNPANFYAENEWLDDMVLGAAELYHSTQKDEYLKYAKVNVKNLIGDGIEWKGTDYLAFAACFKAGIEKAYTKNKMEKILDNLQAKSNEDVYYLSSGYTWGTTALITADAQKTIMYYYLMSDEKYLPLATALRDYLLGRNNWGVSFIVGVGKEYPLNAHSQLNGLAGLHRGAIVGGPAEKQSWLETFPELKIGNDKFSKFQSNIVYYDIEPDYYCNEVALDYTVPSIFLLIHNISTALNNSAVNK